MNALADQPLAAVLAELHEQATADQQRRQEARQLAAAQGQPFAHGWATAYSAVSAEEGRFLHLLALVAEAQHVVEFGCSFGISTIYLAAAARANGGHVITSDFEPAKVAGAQQNITAAGLQEYVTILAGDARATLATVADGIDLLFLDGDKDLYLPLFEQLLPKLSPRAVVVADNADQPGCRPYVAHLTEGAPEFASVALFGGRALVSYRQGRAN